VLCFLSYFYIEIGMGGCMKKILIVGLVCMLILNSCALIFSGESAAVNFNSNPQGVEIWIDGNKMGTTPTRLVLKKNKTYTVVFRGAGYKEQTYVINNRVGALWIVLDVLSGLVPLVIDAATGAWYEFDTTDVNVTLTKDTMSTQKLPEWAIELAK
jgi:PEGA domain